VTVLIDPPRWPAHGRVWSHLVSDESYDELHAFAAAQNIPARGFDHDHYDVPVERYRRALPRADGRRGGAGRLGGLLQRIGEAGLRQPKRDRRVKPGQQV